MSQHSQHNVTLPRLAVIGGGRFGQMHLRAYSQLQRDGRATLAALADIDQHALDEHCRSFGIKGFTDFREMLGSADIDAVGIVTPDHLHREIAMECIAAGKHVLVEKPLDVTPEGCEELTGAARKAGVILQVDFHKRFDPYHREIKRLVDQGACGEVQYGYAHMEDRIEVPRDWFANWAGQSSPTWFLGVHMYDLIRWIISSNARRVYATGVKKKLASLGIDTFDSVQAKVEFENGSHFSFDNSWILPDEFEAVVNQGFRLVGSDGLIECDSQDRGTSSCFSGKAMASHNLGFFMESKDKLGRDRFSGYGIDSIVDFVENIEFILSGGKLASLAGTYASGEDGTEVTRIAAAVHRSIATGQVIDL